MKKNLYGYSFFLLIFLFSYPLSISAVFGQKIDLEQFKNIKARHIGPAAMSGRVTAIDVDIKNDIIYVGAASGGVWRSKSGGTTFEPIFDKESTQSIGAIAIHQPNPALIWVGSGEGNPRNSQNFGDGIFKSMDGGKTWKNMGLRNSRAIHRIIVHRDNPDVVFAGVLGSSYGANEERGVFKTTDGGKTWKKVLYINDQTGVADMIVDPTNPNKIVVAMWEFGRKPFTFSSGGKGSGIYVTHDGFETYEKRTDKDGLPKGELGRCGLAICREKPNVMYALVEAKENAIYRSDDGGAKWRRVGQNGDRPFYYAEIYCDPKNENRLYNIFSRVHRSEDGGKSWSELLDYDHVHPDHHAWWIHPDNPSYMIDGNDGGIAISRDMGANWSFATNLPLGQFYHVNVDNEVPYNLYGGLQDNGSWVGPSAVWRSGGIRNADWQETFFGDGFDVMPRRDNIRYLYSMSQGGFLGYIDKVTGASQLIQPQHPQGVTLRYNWNAALAQNPFSDCGIYYGSQFVHKSMDCGQSWAIISPDLTTNDTSKINASQRTGGLTPDVTNAENHCTILAIAPSPADQNVIWVSTDDGNLQLTTDGGKTWTNLTAKITGLPKNAWLPQIEVSAKNAGEAFVVVNNYRQNDFKPYCFRTTDFGKTWTSVVDAQQIPTYCLSFLQDPAEPNLWFLGTDFGLYLTIDGGKNWTKWTHELPSVPIFDMKIQAREADLVLGTFGRAFVILDDIRPLRALASSKGEVLNQNLKIFEPSAAYLASSRSYQGERFQADAIYEGKNKSPLSMLTIWNKKRTADPSKKDEKKDNKATIKVYTEGGEEIRSFKTELDTGMNRVTWALNRKGIRYPSWDEPREDADEPSGGSVLPGRYKIVVSFNGEKDSTFAEVKLDPRSEVTLKDVQEKDAALKDFQKMVEKGTTAFNRLKEANKTIALIESQVNLAADTTGKSAFMKDTKALKDSILAMQKMFMTERDAKGIIRSSSALMDAVFKAQFMLTSSRTKPQANALYAVEEAKKRLTNILNKVNPFFEKDWSAFQQKVEARKTAVFKKYEALKMD